MAGDQAKRMMARWATLGMTETCVYRPAGDGLAARSITVLVDRDGSEAIFQGRAPALRVTALNDADDGIPSDPTLSDVGKDRIDVAERVGGTAVPRSIQRFVSQDNDLVIVEVQ